MKRKAKFRRMVACDTGPNGDYQVKVYARVYQSGKIVVYREEVTRPREGGGSVDKSAPSKESLESLEEARKWCFSMRHDETIGASIQELQSWQPGALYRVVEAILRELDEVTEKLKRELEKANGQLDIILRECQGDDDASLANDYGGTGWEKEVPVATVRWHRNRWKMSNEAAENLAAEVTQYAERKGEAWRIGEGTEIMDALAAYHERTGR